MKTDFFYGCVTIKDVEQRNQDLVSGILQISWPGIKGRQKVDQVTRNLYHLKRSVNCMEPV